MELSITTPALLFSAISLLLLAYTNRFLAMANLVRSLYDKYKISPDKIIYGQISNLRKRLMLIRNMQFYGIMSLLLCVVSMFLIYINKNNIAEVLFGIALILLIISLALLVREIQISVNALKIHLSDIEEDEK